MRALYLALFLYPYIVVSGQSTGQISGFVRDAKTQERLFGAIIRVEGTSLGAQSDTDGYFIINEVPTASQTVKAALTGYKEALKYDIVVTSGNSAEVNFDLEEQSVEKQEVEIRASPFQKSRETPMSIQTLSQQEIKSYPGGNNDIAKVVQSLPGVSGSVGFRNDVIIRGGAPNENVYYLDGIEIPNINHFATQGSAGGPVGLLNVSFIEDVTLSTSAFPSNYDNVLSGVLGFKQRNGNKDRVQGNVRLGASEFAATLEGPFKKGSEKLTFIGSVRRSYLQFLFKVIDLPFLPAYWDYQYKLNYKINNRTELLFTGVGAIDDFTLNPPKEASLEKLAILEAIPRNSQRSTNGGFTLKRLINNGVLTATLSTNYLDNRATKYDNDDDSDPAKRRLEYSSREWENKFRFGISKFSGQWKYGYGFNITDAHYFNSTFNRLRPEVRDSQGLIIQAPIIIDFKSDLQFFRYGAYANLSRSILNEKIILSAGLRTDMNSFMKDGNNPVNTLSPRAALSYRFLPKWSLNLSWGQYYKIPPYTILGFQDRNGAFANKDAKYIKSTHQVAGFEYLPARATRITVEAFYKQYANYPVSLQDSISLANLGGNFGVLGNEAIRSVGLGRVYGAEFFFQQKFTKRFYGVLSYTYYVSEYTAFDKTKYAASAWDNRHLVSFTGGYKFKRNWEAGLRYRYLGGAPYTPFNERASTLSYARTGQPVFDNSRLNSIRNTTYNALDVRIDKKYNFKKWSLDVYLDIQNAFNAKNPAPPSFTLARNPDNTFKGENEQPFNGANGIPVYLKDAGSQLLPSIGLVIEF